MLLSNWKNSGWWSQFFPLQYGLSSHSLWDLTNQRRADLKQADVYSDKLLIVLPGLQHVLWVHKCKLFLLCTAQFLLEMVLKASMPWARVRLTCPYYTTFCPTVPPHHTRQLIWSQGELKWSQLEHQFLHGSVSWLLCSRYFLFAPHHTLAHSLLLLSSLLLVFLCCIFPPFPVCLWQFVLSTSSTRSSFSSCFPPVN